MFGVRVLSLFLLQSWILLHITWAMLSPLTSATFFIAKPRCPTRCGTVTIPYPFGIGLEGDCSMSNLYNIDCNTSFHPPRPFYGKSNIEIMSISETQVRIKNNVSYSCYEAVNLTSSKIALIDLSNSPFVFSETANKFTVIGCDDLALMDSSYAAGDFTSGCISLCSNKEDVLNGSCSGNGCCQTSIACGLKIFASFLTSANNHANVSSFNPCGYAFLAEEDKYTFNLAHLSDPTFPYRTSEDVPIVLDWAVGVNETCHQARKNVSGYACQQNTNCTDVNIHSAGGYHCSCLPGYEGNPYLTPGCKDIDECLDRSHNCSNICNNIPGSFTCSCPKGYSGDGYKIGTGCTIKNPSQVGISIILGIGFGFLFLLTFTSCIYFTRRRKKLMKMRKKFFEQNGGILLKEQLCHHGRSMNSSKIFTADELRAATSNYSEDRILGKGGYGTVYKGILKDGQEVAIKKSKIVDQSQIEQFINELVILTQINHRNVVKLLGCCLETEVPTLVYEFILHGTLFEHIHRNELGESWLTWENCIRVASEAADALAYLHSAASIPIFHRDVKSTNILLDDKYTAKISDFGASRLVPIDQTQVSTLVQGTLGYLDPEYFQTSQLTEKSDVYSFGVVLVELLTKEKPICLMRKMEQRNLAAYFISSMKEYLLLEIVDPQLVRGANKEQLVVMAKLIKKCLNIRGEERPTMKEVALELEGLKKHIYYKASLG